MKHTINIQLWQDRSKEAKSLGYCFITRVQNNPGEISRLNKHIDYMR